MGTSDEGQPYIVMELLRGEDLGHRIRRLGRLDTAEALRVIAHVLRGLARAHEAGIVHRDLKPDNIFLVERDDDPCFAKILDFGVSKIQRTDGTHKTITREGAVLGTPVYMSPEQAQAQPDVDARSDLWAAGAILYECLAGSPPFSGQSYEAVIVAICTRDPDDIRLRNPEVPEGIASFLKSALKRDRDARFASAREMLDALVAESDGLLPTSLKSDSLRRGVVRSSSSGAVVVGKGAPSLAAVSTIAATPAAAGQSTGGLSPSSGVRGAYVAIGAIALAAGGITAGVWYGSRASAPGVTTNQPQVIVLPGATTTVIVNAPPPAPAPSASAEPAIEPSAEIASSAPAASASATASASAKPRVDRVVVKRAPTAAPTSGPTADPGKLKPADSAVGVGKDLKIHQP